MVEHERTGIVDLVTHKISRIAMWMTPFVVSIMMYEVVLRYLFENPTLWVNEMSLWVAGGIAFWIDDSMIVAHAPVETVIEIAIVYVVAAGKRRYIPGANHRYRCNATLAIISCRACLAAKCRLIPIEVFSCLADR